MAAMPFAGPLLAQSDPPVKPAKSEDSHEVLILGAWMIDEWTKPSGRIHFAGDFTTMKTGWVEGAIESGLRAARQIDPSAKPEAEPGLRQEITA